MWRAFPKSSDASTKLISCALAVLLVSVSSVPVVCQQQAQTDKHAHEIKKWVGRLKRWGKDDPVTVKLYDGTKVKGYITDNEEDHFVLMDRKTGQSTSIDYAEVSDVSGGMGRKTKFALMFAGAILAYVGICAATHRCQN
jgi:hypothetical protein